MKIKMLERSIHISNHARTPSIHKEGSIYEVSEADGKRIIECGCAVAVEEPQDSKPAPKKKTKKPKPAPTPESEELSDGEV